jgi:hypothetical protein
MGGHDPFGGQLAMPGMSPAMGMQGMPAAMPAQPQMQPQMVRGEEESPLILWLAICGGGGALLLIIGMLIYNATKKGGPPVASTPAATPAMATQPGPPPTTPPTPATTTPTTTPTPTPTATTPPMTPATSPPISTGPMITPTTTPSPASGFTPPGHGQMVRTSDNQFEVWMPVAPSRSEQSIAGGKIVIQKATSPAVQARTFALITAQIPNDGSKQDDYYKGTRMGLERGGVTGIQESRITFNGLSAHELRVNHLGIRSRIVSFFSGATAYTLQASDDGASDSEDVKTFWASFGKAGSAKAPATTSGPLTPMTVPMGTPMPMPIPMGTPIIPMTAPPGSTLPGTTVNPGPTVPAPTLPAPAPAKAGS